MHPNIAGALINSALYLICVFIAGLVTGHPVTWKLALVAMGVTYLSHLLQISPDVPRALCWLLVIGSIMLAATAGISLLF